MQIIIRRMTLSDLIINILLKFRFWFIRNFIPCIMVDESPEQKAGRVLTFKDDFDIITWSGTGEGKKWKYGQHWGQFHPDHPHQYSCAPILENSYGLAKFFVDYCPYTFPDDFRTGNPITINHRKSSLSSQPSFEQQYGRFECRCSIPFFRGTWSAFWLWTQQGEKESKIYTEIDIFELYGKEDGKSAGIQCINLHYHQQPEKWQTMMPWKVKIQRDPNELLFHEFVLEWTPKKIELFTDGIRIFRYTRKDILDKYYNQPGQNMWIIIGNGMEKKYVPADDKLYTSKLWVDYIRAYEQYLK